MPSRARSATALAVVDAAPHASSLIEARERILDALESQLDGSERDLELLYRYLAQVLRDQPPIER